MKQHGPPAVGGLAHHAHALFPLGVKPLRHRVQLDPTDPGGIGISQHTANGECGINPAERDDPPGVCDRGIGHATVGLAKIAIRSGLIGGKGHRRGDAVGIHVGHKISSRQRMPIAIDSQMHVSVHDLCPVGYHHSTPRPGLDLSERVNVRPGSRQHRGILTKQAHAQDSNT